MTKSRDVQRLDDKVALITGAAGAIGEATAQLFLKLGARVMLTDLNPGRLAAVERALGTHGEVAAIDADVTDEAAIAKVVEQTLQRFGGLDILIANAGTEGVLKPIEALSADEFETTIRINVTGIWCAMKHCVPALRSRGGGSIVALSSVAGCVGVPGMAAYVASKHAVYGLAKAAALELGAFKIRVNAVAPGPIDNRMMRSLQDQLAPDDPAALRQQFESLIALKRYGTNDEVAQLLAFLSSDAASYCTGSIYVADGGYLAA